MFEGSSPSYNPVYTRIVDPSTLSFSLSSHRYSSIGLLFTSRFIDITQDVDNFLSGVGTSDKFDFFTYISDDTS